MYQIVKYFHIALAMTSVLLFILRFLLCLQWPRLKQHFVFKSLPHFIDTGLVLSAVFLMHYIGQYPFAHHWLSAKLAFLLLYIVFAYLAFKWATSLAYKWCFFSLSLCSIAMVVKVAITKTII
ncbi:SirB2 family protein [Agaribacter flavus]|uniref:SirB2 family protein n=1 Tax=Agaribacter flavus TaxID=1902781 RepID=A0ABV7FWK8_9ALTE